LRSLLVLVLAALLAPAVIAPLAQADGVLYSYEGKVALKRIVGLYPRCTNNASTLRLDIVTALRTTTPAVSQPPAPGVPPMGAIALATIDGGLCGDENVTYIATAASNGGWTLSDPALKGTGYIAPDTNPNTDDAWGVSLYIKNASSLTDSYSHSEARATDGIYLNVTADVG
jgi:hypothetical protein